MIGWNIVFNIYICNLKVSFWNLWVKLKNKNMDYKFLPLSFERFNDPEYGLNSMVMENITIEKMEIKRFNALLMRTIVGMLFMGVLMWETFCLDTGRKGFLGETWYIFAFAVLLYVVVAIRASDILERIKKDKKLMGALDSEIYSDYNSKALTAGFYAAMQMGLLVYCFGDFFNLSVRMGALVIVVVAMLFSEIRRLLLYNPYKDGK